MKLADYVLARSPAYWFPFRTGDMNDYSGNGRHLSVVTQGSMAADKPFSRSKRGWSFFGANNRIGRAKETAMDLSYGDLLTWVFHTNVDSRNIAQCQDVTAWRPFCAISTVGWKFQVTATGKFQPGVTGTIARTWDGTANVLDGKWRQCAAILSAWPAATTITLESYIDGAVDCAAASKDIGGDADPDCTSMVINGTTSSYIFWAGLEDVMLFRSALSIEELRTIRELWLSERGIWRPKRTISLPSRDPAGYGTPLVVLGMVRRFDGKVADLSGNVNDATITGGVEVSAPKGRGMYMQGDTSVLSVAASTTHSDITPSTIACWLYSRGSNSTARRVWSKTAAGGAYSKTIKLQDGGLVSFLVNFDGATDGSWTIPCPPAGQWFHLAIVYDHSSITNDPTFYVNGTEVAETETETPAGSYVSDATRLMYWGNRYEQDSAFEGTIADARFLSGALTAAQVRALYVEGARQQVSRIARADYPISTINIATAGDRYAGWKWTTGSTWTYADDASFRGYSAGVNSMTLTRPQPNAYGTWYFKIKTAGNPFVHIIASLDSTYDDANQDGYSVNFYAGTGITLRRRDNGVATTIITGSTTPVSGQEYEILVSRSPTGLFTLRSRTLGGAWVTEGTATDTTYTASAYALINGGSSTVVGDWRQWVGDLTPTELGLAA